MKKWIQGLILVLLFISDTRAHAPASPDNPSSSNQVSPMKSNIVFDHVGVGVSDLDASVAWYANHFGFEKAGSYELADIGARVAFISLGNVRLELFEFTQPAERASYRSDIVADLRHGGPSHIGLAVGDVRQFAEKLRLEGVVFVIPVTEFVSGVPVTFLLDPSGNLIEIFPMSAISRRGG
jgi:catechol 2,3-dioxygenase-like lactoylglutathione lyase family enzyme